MVTIPKMMRDELEQLAATDEPLRNLASVEVLEEWLADVKTYLTEEARKRGHTLEQIGAAQHRHPQAVHRTLKKARAEGLTHRDFNGVSSSTLRYWLDWWEDPARERGGKEEAGRDPNNEAQRIRKELEAREELGRLFRPASGLQEMERAQQRRRERYYGRP